jgi:hypothetical protein
VRHLANTVICLVLMLTGIATIARAQELVPAAFLPAPVGFNVVTVASNFSRGEIAFDPSLPVEEASARLGVGVLGVARTLGIAGRYANIGVGMPLVFGTVQGVVLGQAQRASRQGNGDLSTRVAINLYGGPALTGQAFAAYRAPTIVGLSLVVTAPIGQYDPSRFINLGTNRWSFKPELGLARRRGGWTIEGDFSATVFTDNPDYVGGRTRQQSPIIAFQGHLIRTFRPGLWIAADVNFWNGGRVSTDGQPALLEQRNSRLGVTVAVPARRHQLRASYSLGAYTTIGGDYHSLGLSYSYAWAAR